MRLQDIERAKGLAIVLVVFGHIVARQHPADNEWYSVLKQVVYSFHMAFFMFLSGVVFFIRAAPSPSFNDYATTVRTRFFRLMPAYFLFALIVYAGKLLAQEFLHVDNAVNGIDDLLKVALFPMQSGVSFLWYIYTLFLFSISSVALLTASNNRLWPLLLLGAALQFAPYFHILGLGQFAKYYLFFVLGGAAIRAWDTYTHWLDKLWLLAVALFLIAISMHRYSGATWVAVAVFSIPALHGFCRQEFPGRAFLAWLGGMSFAIYLMNTMAIGFVKALMMKVVNWDGVMFPTLFLPALMVAGLLIPIAAKKFAFTRVRWLDRITA